MTFREIISDPLFG